MKHCLFLIALLFASLFVMSTLCGFVLSMIGLFTGSASEEAIAVQSYLFTGIGLVGWIATSLALVLADEHDELVLSE